MQFAERLAMHSGNRLKLGMFGPNCSAGLAKTKVPERWSGSWSDNLALAQMLDEAGIEFILPVGRWRGYGGETDPQSAAFETVTWATGLLSATRNITIFGTVHATLIHPLFAAKMCVTADHAGNGRFGLNIVCGSQEREFAMFGVPLREGSDAYALGEEWVEIVRRLWESEEPFDYDGAFFNLKRAQAHPKPFGGTRPLILNAGSSAIGRAFAVRQADALFTGFETLEQGIEDARTLRSMASNRDRPFGLYTQANVVCRPTTSEAEAYYHYFADELADWGALASRSGYKRKDGATEHGPDHEMRVRLIAGYGGWPCIGDPDHVARELATISAAGYDGVALGFVDYLAEFPYFRDEVLPRLEKLGLRQPLRVEATLI